VNPSQELATLPQDAAEAAPEPPPPYGDGYGYGDGETPSLPSAAEAINTLQVTCSWSLINHLRNMARNEGVRLEDLALELLSESAAKRAFEDQRRPTPSHLMTRTGYVPQGPSDHYQPQMTHHENSSGGNNWGDAGYGAGRPSYNRPKGGQQQNFNQKNYNGNNANSGNRYQPRKSGNRG
jgi:hypothetical protein